LNVIGGLNLNGTKKKKNEWENGEDLRTGPATKRGGPDGLNWAVA
jgi:hypothetical protein